MRYKVFFYSSQESVSYAHLEQVMDAVREYVGEDPDMYTQFEAIDTMSGEDISHNVYAFLAWQD